MKRLEKLERWLAILICLTLAFIWGHSLVDAEMSSEESGLVMRLVAPILELFVGEGKVTEHLVRKLAHFSEFALLGMELCLFFTGRKQRKRDGLFLALAHGLFAGLMDETIQIFSGRGPMVQDVWIDFSGVTTGAIFQMAVFVICLKLVAMQRRKAMGKAEEANEKKT